MKVGEPKIVRVEARGAVHGGPRNGSQTSKGHSRKVRMQSLAQLPVTGAPTKVPARKGTGPRTKRGKERSRYNALKHGIFSQVLLLDGESARQYQSLVASLRADRRPQGALEESIVDELAMLKWRKRRGLRAERAEIAKVVEFAAEDWATSQRSQRDEVVDVGNIAGGMLHRCSNPYVLDECINLLKGMRWNLKHNGFNPKNDYKILAKIYGESLCGGPPYGFFTAYTTLGEEAQNALSESAAGTNSVYEEKRIEALKSLAKEIRRLRFLRKFFFDSAMHRVEYVQQAASVPSEERFLRYEAHLDRAIDRALRQLERLQRMRSGESVPPSIEVRI